MNENLRVTDCRISLVGLKNPIDCIEESHWLD